MSAKKCVLHGHCKDAGQIPMCTSTSLTYEIALHVIQFSP